MQPEGSLPHSQVPTTCPYPEPHRSIPCLPSNFLKFHSNIFLLSKPGSSKFPFPSDHPTKTSYIPLLHSIRATFHAHRILHDFVTRKISVEEYRSLSSPLCRFLHSPVTLSLLGPNIPLDTLFSDTLSLRHSLNCYSINVNDQVSHPY